MCNTLYVAFAFIFSIQFPFLLLSFTPQRSTKKERERFGNQIKKWHLTATCFFFWFMLESQIVPNITVPQKVFLSEPKATISYSHRVFSMSVFTISSCAQLVIFQQLHWAMCTNVCAYSCRKKADVRQNVHRLAVNQYKHQLQQFFEFAAGV